MNDIPIKKTASHAATHKIYHYRFLRNSAFSLVVIGLSLYMGMTGYHYLEQLPWLDAYLNAAMILSGMGPVHTPVTSAGKFFAGSYALFSGILFLVIVAVVFSPLFHKLFHTFLVKEDKH